MNLRTYLEQTAEILQRKEQRDWFTKLRERVESGRRLYNEGNSEFKQKIYHEFLNRVRTEEVKAWYSTPEGDSVFQGTSISSLTIPYKTDSPFELQSVVELEEHVANAYIEMHNKYAGRVKSAIMEDIDEWLRQGLYYGVVIGSKIVSQAFGLFLSREEVVFKVGDLMVDPHEITAYPDDIRRVYFDDCLKRIKFFEGLGLERRELESSLVLADISKPKIDRYKDRIILAPVRCNEIAAILSERITRLIIKKTSGKISPKGLTVVIYDTDTPYTYHEIMGYSGNYLSPALPGLIVLGSSGTIDAFRWLYTYRASLIAQKIMKSSLYSEMHKCFIPFVFFGVLVPRDAQILLDTENLHRLRYKGNIAPDIEFAYLMPSYYKFVRPCSSVISMEDLKENI